MEKKEIHLVFQVLNFLSSSFTSGYNLSSNEKLLIIFLAKHHGQKGIYPKIKTLKKGLNLTERSVSRLIKLLESKNIISVIRREGMSNKYTINIEKLSTTPDTSVLKSYPQPPTPVSGTPDTSVRDPRHQCPYINNNINTEDQKDVAIDIASTFFDFVPKSKSQELAKKLGLDLEDQIIRFKSRHSGKGNLQIEFEKWLMNSRQYMIKNTSCKKLSIKEYGPGHPTWEANRSFEKRRDVNEKAELSRI